MPLDRSCLSEAALAELPHVAGCGAQLRLLNVMSYPVHDWLVTDAALGALVAADMEHVAREARAYLECVAAPLRAAGFRVSCDVHSGPVADAILETAERMDADLIAMSTHGRGEFGRLLLGSVAARIVQRAHMPVLLVRPREAGC